MRAFSRSPFHFYDPEEWTMSQQNQATPAQTNQAAQPAVAPTIAIRKSCNPDGIGLSHYVLMDKKVAK